MNGRFQTPTGAMNAVGLLKSIMRNLAEAEYGMKLQGVSADEAVGKLVVAMPSRVHKVLCKVSTLNSPREGNRIRGVGVIINDDLKANYAIYQKVGEE